MTLHDGTPRAHSLGVAESRCSWFGVAEAAVLARVVGAGAEHFISCLVGEAGHGVYRKHSLRLVCRAAAAASEGSSWAAATVGLPLARRAAARASTVWRARVVRVPDGLRVHDSMSGALARLARQPCGRARCNTSGGPAVSGVDVSGASEPVPGSWRCRGGAREAGC